MLDVVKGLIGALVGALIVVIGNYIVQRQIRKWQIEDEQRKMRQEPLKQVRQKVQDMIVSASKCLVSGSAISDIPQDHFGNLFSTIEYLYQKHVLEKDKTDELAERLGQAWKQGNAVTIIEIGSEVRAWIDEAIDITFQGKHCSEYDEKD